MQKMLSSSPTRQVALVLAVLLLSISTIPRAEAAFISSAEVLSAYNRDHDVAVLQKTLENKLIQARLQAMGYSADEIKQRLDQLSDQDIHQVASRIDQLTAGGNGLGLIIAILVIILLVVLILKLMDKRITIS